MGNIFNEDFIDFLQVISKYKVEYILVGGYAVILHGYNRTTGDLDIWVKRSKKNFKKIQEAFFEFGLPGDLIEINDFLYNEEIEVYTFGRPPVCIDLMTKVKGLEFDETFKNSIIYQIDDIEIKVVNYQNLIEAKRTAGRFKDLNDIEKLEEDRSWKKS